MARQFVDRRAANQSAVTARVRLPASICRKSAPRSIAKPRLGRVNYYEHHLGDYARKTSHLTLLEHGVYRRLLDLYYIHEAPLPAKIEAIQRLVGARTQDEREAVETIVNEFFALADDGWHNSKCDEEIIKAHERMERARENGKRGGRPRKETQKKPNPNPEKTQSVFLGYDLETQTKAHQSPGTRHQLDDDNARARLDRMEADLREAAGEALDPTSTGLMVLDRPHAWARDGCDFDLDVLPAIRAASARASPQSIRSWKYFDRAVADAKARRMKPTPEGVADERSSPDTRARENHLAGIREALAARSGGAGG